MAPRARQALSPPLPLVFGVMPEDLDSYESMDEAEQEAVLGLTKMSLGLPGAVAIEPRLM